METLDGFSVSFLTGLCDLHAEMFVSLATQVLDDPDDDGRGGDEGRLEALRRYLGEERAECIKNCGRSESER